VPKINKSFRLSETALARLERLAQKAELNRTAYLEQLLKREAEKILPKTEK
jgi:predicted transcriptional regulator